jgi:hypothetical protein
MRGKGRIYLMFRFILLALAIASATFAGEADIYIVAGQSNGWRLSSLAAAPGKDSHMIHYFGMACGSRPTAAKLQQIDHVNPKTSGAGLATALLQQSKKDIVFIQYCVCGSSLNDVANWQPGEDPLQGKVNDAGLYGCFSQYLADARRQLEALGIKGKVRALFWHQGESDVRVPPERHKANLQRLFARFRQDLGQDLRIVAGHIRELDQRSRGVNQTLDAIASADPLTTVIPLVDLEFESATDVHIKPASCIKLGQRMADSLLRP